MISSTLNTSNSSLVSVIVPINRTENLDKTYQSIVNQTYSNLEIIFVYNGKVEPQLYPETIELSSEESISKALNVGLDYASGDFIARLDVGDEWASNHIELLVNFLTKNPQIDLVSASVGSALSKEKEPIVRYDSNFTRDMLLIGNPIKHSAVMFRKTADRYNPDFDGCEDWEFWTRAFNSPVILKNVTVRREFSTKVYNNDEKIPLISSNYMKKLQLSKAEFVRRKRRVYESLYNHS